MLMRRQLRVFVGRDVMHGQEVTLKTWVRFVGKYVAVILVKR
jgi:hypothetical protein